MNNKDFITRIAKKTGRTDKEVIHLITALKMVIADAAENGSEVALPGLGTFKTEIKEEYVRNDKENGKNYLVPPKAQTVFEVAQTLLTKIKNSYHD